MGDLLGGLRVFGTKTDSLNWLWLTLRGTLISPNSLKIDQIIDEKTHCIYFSRSRFPSGWNA